jgi:hypothetical protein
MWKVKYTLQDKNPAGEVIHENVIGEAGFDNQGQAEAWHATGARERYGVLFWHRCVKIEVIDEPDHVINQVPPPPFYAGGAYE